MSAATMATSRLWTATGIESGLGRRIQRTTVSVEPAGRRSGNRLPPLSKPRNSVTIEDVPSAGVSLQLTRIADALAFATGVASFFESRTVTVCPVTSSFGTICSAHLAHNHT